MANYTVSLLQHLSLHWVRAVSHPPPPQCAAIRDGCGLGEEGGVLAGEVAAVQCAVGVSLDHPLFSEIPQGASWSVCCGLHCSLVRQTKSCMHEWHVCGISLFRGLTLLDGSFFHQLGLFLLLSALLYALLVAGMKSHGISLAEVLDR